MEYPYGNESGITVGELISQLSLHPRNEPVCFGPHAHFTFYRVKDRAGVTQIEFNETLGVDYDLLSDHHYVQYRKEHGL